MQSKTIGVVAGLLYIGCIFLANWLISNVGVVPVGFGLMAPAGVFAVGATFTFRDVTQAHLGRWPVVAAILVGAGLSYLIAGPDKIPGGLVPIAVASGLAFLVSEASDFAVYTPLRERNWIAAVSLSNTVGAVFDSLIFLYLAFGSLEFFAGQVVGKSWVMLVSIALLYPVRRALLPRDA